MTLADHLAACVREAARIKGSTGAAHDLRVAVRADPMLAAAAHAHLATLVDEITAKCHIARTHKAAIQEALQ